MYWALALGEEPDRVQPSKNERQKEHAGRSVEAPNRKVLG
jgi:hypothetical protein